MIVGNVVAEVSVVFAFERFLTEGEPRCYSKRESRDATLRKEPEDKELPAHRSFEEHDEHVPVTDLDACCLEVVS